MRGFYCEEGRVALRRDLAEPSPLTGEVPLKVRAVGICDTDLQIAQGYMGFRGILGHEFVGETVDGTRVTAEINNACHICPVCRAGRSNHCPNRTVLGILNHDGAMADYVTVPKRNLHAIPSTIDDGEAIFIEPLAAAFRIVEQIQLGPEVSFAVLGDGKLGLLCAWAARLQDARVHLIGKHAEKLKLAGPSIETYPLESLNSRTPKFDVVVDCTGSSSGFPTAMNLVRPCGTIVLKTTIAGTYSINLAPLVIDEIRVIGSRCGPFPKAIEALSSKAIDVRPLIGAVYSLDDADEAFRKAGEKGSRKILLRTSKNADA